MVSEVRRHDIRGAGVVGVFALAGCSDGDGGASWQEDGGDGTEDSASGPEAVVREWLQATTIEEVNEVAHPDADAYIESEDEANPYLEQENTIHTVERRSPSELAEEMDASPSEVQSQLDSIAEEYNATDVAIAFISVTRGSEDERYESNIAVVKVDGEWLVLGE